MKQALLNPGAAADSQDVGMQHRTAVMTGKSAGTAFLSEFVACRTKEAEC